MNEELKPCPFCGAHAETDFILDKHSYAIECYRMGCAARIIKETERDAVEAWNRRAPRGAVQEESERLRELAATCYAGLGGECNLPAAWLDALNAAANGEPFSVEGLLPFTLEAQQAAVQMPAQLSTALDRFDAYFRSMNSAPPNARISVPTAEWQELRAMLEAAKASVSNATFPTPPAQERKPLTDEQISGLERFVRGTVFGRGAKATAFARAVERAHNIT